MIPARSALPGFAIAIAVLIAGLVLALTVGRYPVSLGDLIAVLIAKLGGPRGDVSPAVESVIWQVRGPRVMTAMLVGAALAVAGTAFQGLFRNPLVSPDILGASSGAALGAVLGIYLSLGVFAIQAIAFGELRAAVEPLGEYRLHSASQWTARDFEKRVELGIRSYDIAIDALERNCRRLGLPADPEGWRRRSWS